MYKAKAYSAASATSPLAPTQMFNYREGFRREDDRLPDRFFEDAFTIGQKKGAVLDRNQFDAMLTRYYTERGWDPETTRPGNTKLKELGLDSI